MPIPFVLVHGAFEDATIWNATSRLLDDLGAPTLTAELPGRGANAAPAAEITLDSHRDAVLAVVESAGAPVVLVGHSFGGIVISAVAEAAPEKIHRLVYLAAYLPTSGQSLQDLASQDRDSRMGPNFLVDTTRLVAEVRREVSAALFVNDGSAELQTSFPATILPEPLPPLGTPVTLSAERFGRVQKTYVKTARDLVVSPYLQDRMLAATPVDDVLVLDTGHAPFLTAPEDLARTLASVGS